MNRDKLKDVKRIVVKVGSSTITYPNGKINYEKIEKLARCLGLPIAVGRRADSDALRALCRVMAGALAEAEGVALEP